MSNVSEGKPGEKKKILKPKAVSVLVFVVVQMYYYISVSYIQSIHFDE